MRSQAEAIGASDPGRRLAVPAADDEIHRLGVTLNDLLQRLEGAVQVERTFVADASHELRTPLSILKAELEFALRPARTDDERLLALQAAAEETDRIVRLSEDLLVIARAHDGGLALRSEPVDIAELLATVIGRHRRTAEQQGVRIVVRHVTTGPPLHGDRLRLEQAVGNILDNAIGHARSSTEVSVSRDGPVLTVAVSDDGDGFPHDFLPHAFERFTRADKARGRGGSGLGLSIVEAIATAHGGHAHAANEPDGGARVSLTLPLTDDDGDLSARSDR